MRRVRPIPCPSRCRPEDPRCRHPGPDGREHPELAVPTGRRRGGHRPDRPPLPHAIGELWKTVYADRLAAAAERPEADESIEMLKVQRSAQWLADHFDEVPLFLFAFVQADPTGGSIYPAVWSAQLAARAQGVGSSLTVVLGFFHPDETFEILGVPTDEQWMMAVLRELRLSDRTVGGGAPAARPRGLLPQPVGVAGRLRGRPAAVAPGVEGRADGVARPPGPAADHL